MRVVWHRCVLLLITCISSLGIAQTTGGQTKGPTWLQVPLPAASPPKTVAELAKTNARAAAFNDKTGSLPPLDSEPGPSMGVDFAVDYLPMPPFPAAQSTTVVLGTVESYQPFLSRDHTAVYTELNILIEEIYKDTSAVAHAHDVIVVTMRGGALQLPNGKVLRTGLVMGGTILDVQRRYVLFLNYTPSVDAFGVLTAWQLQNGHAIAVTPQNISAEANGKSRYHQMDEPSFLAAVRSSIGNNQ